MLSEKGSSPHPTALAIALMVLGLFTAGVVWYGYGPESRDGGDPWGYYAHLPAFFIYHDAGDYSKTIDAYLKSSPGRPDPRDDVYGLKPTPTGKWAIKYPLGPALLQLPFFAVAHGYAGLSGAPQDGFSPPYDQVLSFSTPIYVAIGFYLLALVLLSYFPPRTVWAVCFTLTLATNLWYFTVLNSGMAHGYQFMAFSCLVFATERFYQRMNFNSAAGLGAALGLITLIRLPEAMAVLLPLCWGVWGRKGISDRALLIWKHIPLLGVAVAVWLVFLLPQMGYFWLVSGKLLYNGYVGETFDWLHPRILGGWFSYRNGWLVYTPVMVFALAGLAFLPRYARNWVWPIAVFMPPYLYFTYAWWCWYYINGFGSRPMVETYPLWAFPLAALFQWTKTKGWRVVMPLSGALLALLALNLFQTWQMNAGWIQTESMNRAHFWAMFGKTKAGPDEVIAAYSNERQPDQPGLIEPMATFVTQPVTPMDSVLMWQVAAPTLKKGDWVRVSWEAYIEPGKEIWDRARLAHIYVLLDPGDGRYRKGRGMALTALLTEDRYSIWQTGEPGHWKTMQFFVQVHRDFTPKGVLTVEIRNPGGQVLEVRNVEAGKMTPPA